MLLTSFGNNLDTRFCRVGVHELAEPANLFGILNGRFPFALVGIHQMLHHLFQLGCYPQLVVNNHITDVFDAAFELLAPDGRSSQAFGRHDVIDEEAIDVSDGRFFINVRCQ